MTSLNNQELRKKIDDVVHQSGVGEEYQVRVLKASLLALFESELANRERVARIAELEVVKSQITEAHMILSPCGYRHTIEYILHPEIIEDRIAQLKNNTTKQEDIKDE